MDLAASSKVSIRNWCSERSNVRIANEEPAISMVDLQFSGRETKLEHVSYYVLKGLLIGRGKVLVTVQREYDDDTPNIAADPFVRINRSIFL